FDKTGTLTLGQPHLLNAREIEPRQLAVAAALAGYSRHPLSQAIAAHVTDSDTPTFDRIEEKPGFGMEAQSGSDVWRLGRASWAGEDGESGTVLSLNGNIVARFAFEDRIRADARESLEQLQENFGPVEMLSG